VLFALFLATSGMLSLMSAFNRIHQTRENRSYLKSRSVATVLTVILFVVLLIAILLLVIGQVVIDWVYHQNALMEDFIFYLIITLRFLIMYVAFYLGISSIYYLGPSIHQRWHFFSPGSQVATLMCLAVSFLFSSYISNFGTYNKLYGSIGALIALMVWMYMISVILLVGYTINASIDVALDRLGIKPARASAMHIERVELGHPANAPDEGTK
jgi:membrane protein